MDISDDVVGLKKSDTSPELLETFFKYLRYWRWYIFSILCFLLLAFVYLRFTTPLYKIEAQLLIKDDKNSLSGANDLLKDLDLFSSNKITDNEIAILKSRIIIEKVVKSLDLTTQYYNIDGFKKREIYDASPFKVELLSPAKPPSTDNDGLIIHLLNDNQAMLGTKMVPLNQPINTDKGIILITKNQKYQGKFDQKIEVHFINLLALVESYIAAVKIDPVSKEASVLTITIEDAIPQRGVDFLNGLMQEYNNAAVEDKNRVASNTLNFINERLKVISGGLVSVEKNVEDYKSQNGIANISDQSKTLLQGMGDNDAQLTKVDIQLGVLQNLESYLQKDNNQQTALPSMLGIDDASLLGLVEELGQTQLRRLSLLQTVPETNPLVSSLDDQISALKQSISKSVQNLQKGLQITRNQLQARNNQFQGVVKHVPSQERGLLDVMREQQLQDTVFKFLLQKREETQMQQASSIADSRIVDTAYSTAKPIKPVKALVVFTFFLAGILVPSAIIYIAALLNVTVSRRKDIEAITNVPILGEISHSSDMNVFVASRPKSMIAEQVRALRTNLDFIIPDKDQKVILVTSMISGEGKSFVSLNLGSSLAMSGKKVVIIELDMRRPGLHSRIGVDNTIGLSNYLVGKSLETDIVKPIESQENYFIITSGPTPPNPAELLGNGRLGDLINDLSDRFDYIMIDAPPIGLVTDAQIVAKYANATLFIVRHNYSAKKNIYPIDAFYRSQKFPHVNIVINSIVQKVGYGSYYGSYYGYGYGYGYGGYYTQDENNKDSKLKKMLKKEKS